LSLLFLFNEFFNTMYVRLYGELVRHAGSVFCGAMVFFFEARKGVNAVTKIQS